MILIVLQLKCQVLNLKKLLQSNAFARMPTRFGRFEKVFRSSPICLVFMQYMQLVGLNSCCSCSFLMKLFRLQCWVGQYFSGMNHSVVQTANYLKTAGFNHCSECFSVDIIHNRFSMSVMISACCCWVVIVCQCFGQEENRCVCFDKTAVSYHPCCKCWVAALRACSINKCNRKSALHHEVLQQNRTRYGMHVCYLVMVWPKRSTMFLSYTVP